MLTSNKISLIQEDKFNKFLMSEARHTCIAFLPMAIVVCMLFVCAKTSLALALCWATNERLKTFMFILYYIISLVYIKNKFKLHSRELYGILIKQYEQKNNNNGTRLGANHKF